MDTTTVSEALRRVFASRPSVPVWLDERASVGPNAARAVWQEHAEDCEAHIRLYVADGLLETLGWSVSPSRTQLSAFVPNMSIEVPLRPLTARYRKRLDYFGFDSQLKPLLVVETKAPNLLIEAAGTHVHPSNHPWIPRLVQLARPRTGARRGRPLLPAGWTDAIYQLADYVRDLVGANETPKRAMLTNGDWFVIFPEPGWMALNQSQNPPEAPSVFVFDTPDKLLEYLDTVRRLLDFRFLSPQQDIVPVAQVAAYVDPAQIVATVQGLRVLRVGDQKWVGQVPRLEVSPYLLLVGSAGQTLAVHDNEDFLRMPFHNDAGIPQHLHDVAGQATQLRARAEAALGVALPVPASINDATGLLALPMVSSIPGLAFTALPTKSCFLVLTGDASHFLAPDASYSQCAGHEVARLPPGARADPSIPVLVPSVSPRAFFPNHSVFHCAHAEFANGRRIRLPDGRVAPASDYTTGSRETCFMLPIDEMLCCRQCCFRALCLPTTALRGAATRCQMQTPTLEGGPIAASHEHA